MVLIFNASSPTKLPDAITAPVVSMVPPSQAPVTASESPSKLAMKGMNIIIGIAVMRTTEMTYDNFFASPLMAPADAMAAETPQMETALEIIMDNSSSIPIFLQSQKAKYHTATTTSNAWMKPRDPAFKMSPKMILLPNKTNPILT